MLLGACCRLAGAPLRKPAYIHTYIRMRSFCRLMCFILNLLSLKRSIRKTITLYRGVSIHWQKIDNKILINQATQKKIKKMGVAGSELHVPSEERSAGKQVTHIHTSVTKEVMVYGVSPYSHPIILYLKTP